MMFARCSCFVVVAVAIGCASSRPVPDVRFGNAASAIAVNDRRDVPRPPAPRTIMNNLYQFDGSVVRVITRALDVPRPRRARGVNAVDDVPDSTWFTNRIGVRDMSPDEIRTGFVVVGTPEAHLPWTVISGKPKGATPGFTIIDSRGDRFLLKLEKPGLPETESATDVIVNRLLWAFGYNVPEDHVVYFHRSDLRVDPKATTRDARGHTVRLDRAAVARQLATVDTSTNGRIRAVASRLIDGKPLGGHPGEGVRTDDPNDRIPHELRRDLRGAYAINSWLDHTDLKEANTLDTWIADPADPTRHYVKHYLLDFGRSLGVMAVTDGDLRRGHAYALDFGEMFASLITAGGRSRHWEGRSSRELRGVGLYDVTDYDPGTWKAYTAVYLPMRVADRFDKFWGAKILIRFTPEQLRAAVAAGRLSDPRAADYLVKALIARQRATARYWFERVTPLDQFEVAKTARGQALCFDDLALAHQLASAAQTEYVVTTYDRAGRAIRGGRFAMRPTSSRTCMPLVVAGGSDDYTMVRVKTQRPGLTADGTIIHLARDPLSWVPRVVGLWRL